MSSIAPEDFQKLLDQHYKWPDEYMFKFIVKSELKDEIQQLETILQSLTVVEQTTRPSHGGKYIAYSTRASMESSAQVVEVYEKVSEISAVIAI